MPSAKPPADDESIDRGRAVPTNAAELGDASDASDAGDELAGLSYEQAREELGRVVQQLESGGAPLAASLALWERGERLATICQNWLDGAKATIEAAARKRGD